MSASTPEALLHQARIQLARGQISAARDLLASALASAPERVDLQVEWARVELAAGDARAAETICRRILSAAPDTVQAWIVLGEALVGSDAAGAEAAWQEALAREPDHAEALFHVGRLHLARGDHGAAIAIYERALRSAPGHPSILIDFGIALDRAGQPARAEASYREVLARRATQIEATANLADLLFRQARFAEALAFYDRLLSLIPGSPAEIWNNRGVCLRQLGRTPLAAESFRKALGGQRSAETLANLGFVEYELNNHDRARELLREAHALKPERLQVKAQLLDLDLHRADWNDFEQKREEIVAGVAALAPGSGQAVPPFAFLALCDDPALQLAAARHFAWPAAPIAGTQRRSGSLAVPLRLGFVASTFHDHPVARLVVELFERIDRSRFELCAYTVGQESNDAMRGRISRAVPRMRKLSGQSTDVIVRQIQADAIDILFDLSGHTGGARPDVFAARAAALQINYLGYAGSMGSAQYDFVATDAYTTPLSEQPHFAERLWHVSSCYLPSDSTRTLGPSLPERSEYGLDANAFVLMSQASAYKLLPDMFRLWLRLLGAIDDAVLWLRPQAAAAESNLRSELRRAGLADERLRFAPFEATARYLTRFRLAHLYLDTYPFGSHTTVNDALFAGLPAITLEGRSMAARASAAQLHAAGLPRLIARSHGEYEAIALGLARDRTQLAEIARELRTRGPKSVLFDMTAYTKCFEDGLVSLWQDHCARASSSNSE